MSYVHLKCESLEVLGVMELAQFDHVVEIVLIDGLQEKPTWRQVHRPLWRTHRGNFDQPQETQQVLHLLPKNKS